MQRLGVCERARSGTDVKLVRLLKFETVFLDIVGNDKCDTWHGVRGMYLRWWKALMYLITDIRDQVLVALFCVSFPVFS